MQRSDLPAPEDGFVLTHFLVVSDPGASRDFYVRLLDADVVLEENPVILRAANSWVILNTGGPGTHDKPDITLDIPDPTAPVSAFINLRVADIERQRRLWRDRGIEFLTDPVDWGGEIRAYVRDPDGHLIEVGQATGILEMLNR